VNKPGDEVPKIFTFDSVYDWNSEQENVFNESAWPIIDNVLQGYNGTIFAYGQTGTGKTFTITGVPKDPTLKGIMPRSFEAIFNQIQTDNTKEYLVRASYLEIYNEEIKDLLVKNGKRLDLKDKDTGVYVKDLSTFVVKTPKDLMDVFDEGNLNRHVGATLMNEHSSRSHSVFTITVESSVIGDDGKAHIKVGKLNIVDLAGSER
jgi:kinesin family member 3B